MKTKKKYTYEFKDKLMGEVNAYQSEHKTTKIGAIRIIAEKYNLTPKTISNWYYMSNEGKNLVIQHSKKRLAAVTINKDAADFNVKDFLNGLSPFKRMLACFIGLHKYL